MRHSTRNASLWARVGSALVEGWSMKRPVLNASAEAIRLRKAAQAFAYHSVNYNCSLTEHDVKGQRFNIALLHAAERYADAVRKVKGSK